MWNRLKKFLTLNFTSQEQITSVLEDQHLSKKPLQENIVRVNSTNPDKEKPITDSVPLNLDDNRLPVIKQLKIKK